MSEKHAEEEVDVLTTTGTVLAQLVDGTNCQIPMTDNEQVHLAVGRYAHVDTGCKYITQQQNENRKEIKLPS